MLLFEKINFSLTGSVLLLAAGIFILILLSIWIYKYTIPAISPSKKIILTALRALTISLLFFAIFEPVFSVFSSGKIEPLNLFFIDNSKSIAFEDGSKKKEAVGKFLEDLKNSGLQNSSRVYLFDENSKPLVLNKEVKLNYNGSSTNFSSIFAQINSIDNVSTATIISDGVITSGTNPLYSAAIKRTTLFTVGVGDSLNKNDIAIINPLFNEYVYLKTPTTISASLASKDNIGKIIKVSLFDGNQLVQEKNVTLNSDNENITFEYTPQFAGERKLSLRAESLKDEKNKNNNNNFFYINVLDNKIKVAVLAASPSPDLSFIKNSLESNKDIVVNTITHVGNGKYLENNNKDVIIDSADIYFLVGFPADDTPNNLVQRVFNNITKKNKSFFISLSGNISYSRLNEIKQELPFTYSKNVFNEVEVQPSIKEDALNNPLLKSDAGDVFSSWNNLPPVIQPDAGFAAKPESDVVANIKINNVTIPSPLILTKKLGSKRSTAILAKDLWRWKLQTASKKLNVFDYFFMNLVQWLNSDSQRKQVKIKTNKKFYSKGEEILFTAQVYDESFNVLSDAEVKLKIQGSENKDIYLNSLGGGLYDGKFVTSKPGDYKYAGQASFNNKIVGTDNGSFSIGDVDFELVNTYMDKEFLTMLANENRGKFYPAGNYDELFSQIKNLNNKGLKEKRFVDDYKLWSNEYILIAIILLFSIEWFIRKRSGMM